jgi:hypothetical protein
MIVWYEGSAMELSECVMATLGLHQGQNITEAQMWEGIRLNAAEFVMEMTVRGHSILDLTRLKLAIDGAGK